jgi:hypothetical protein
MSKYMNQSKANQKLAAKQTHDDLRPGHGVIAMPTHDEIARRAYDLYVRNGRTMGHCEQNWLQAEQELHKQGQYDRGTPHRIPAATVAEAQYASIPFSSRGLP